jgi:hypothetical protein
MAAPRRKPSEELDVRLSVDDEELDQLAELTGQRVVHAVVWEDSVMDAFDAGEFTDTVSDIDLYLEDSARFELFAVLCYPSLDDAPFDDASIARAQLLTLVKSSATLAEVAADTEECLVLVLSDGDRSLYLNAGAWSLDEWEELPD